MKPAPSTRDQLDRVMVLVRRSLAFWKRGLAVFMVGALIAVPFVFTRPRSYRSETVILYQETIRSTDVIGGDGSSDSPRRVSARLRELLLSRASLDPIIRDVNLYPTLVARGALVEAVEEMRKNIVFRAQEGDTYDISFTGDSPKEVQEVTRRLGECVMQQTATSREEKAKALKEFLTAESVRNEAELQQKEDDLTRFVALHPEYALRLQGLPADAKGSSTGPGIAGTATDPVLASLDARAARIERQLGARSPVGIPKPSASFQPPPDSAELVAARRDLADKLVLYTDKHPDVIAARNRLQAAEAQQAALNNAAAAAWRAQQGDDPGPPPSAMDAVALRRELASIQAQMAARRRVLAGAPAPPGDAGASADLPVPPGAAGSELEFRRLQREVSDGRDRQQQLEERLFRASIAANSVMDDRNIQVSILDPAYLPDRAISKPRSMMLAALLAVSLLLAMATAIVSANLDDRIHDRQDIERLDLLPIIAVIPKPPAQDVRRLPPPSDPLEGSR
jgi:polysaccharide biosynthesis transport protein